MTFMGLQKPARRALSSIYILNKNIEFHQIDTVCEIGFLQFNTILKGG